MDDQMMIEVLNIPHRKAANVLSAKQDLFMLIKRGCKSDDIINLEIWRAFTVVCHAK